MRFSPRRGRMPVARPFSFPLMPFLSAALLLFLPLATCKQAIAEETAVKTYYVDCQSGNDNNSGTSSSQAWRSMSKANGAALAPGDSLLFKRGCTWSGTALDARWVGTAAQPILIGAYGSGALPLIQNAGSSQNVKITGSYQILEFLRVRSDPLVRDPLCENQPVGWQIGFNFLGGATHNTLRYSQATEHTAGVRLAYDANDNHILHNTITNNHVMQVLDPGGSADLGAWGVVVNGDRNEIAYNFLSDNNGWCAYDFVYTGNSVEVYAGRGNLIHHNTAVNDKVFSELGGSADRKAEDNVYAYNVHISSMPSARFLVVRGSGSDYGPTWRTTAINNTVYLTDAASQAVVCSAGCNSQILTLRNNILWAQEKAAYADGPFDEGYNIYWRTGGDPFVQFQGFAMSGTSRKADPQFVNAAAQNLHLNSTSPAINGGSDIPLTWGYNADSAGMATPRGAQVDIGALEYVSTATPWRIPGRIEAENYRNGGAGTGFHDTTNGNNGNVYRSDSVDIQGAQDLSGDFNTAWSAVGEWLAYDVNVATEGSYRFTLRVATTQSNRRLHLEIDGVDVTGPLTVPVTGGWQRWGDLVTSPIALSPGLHTLRVVLDTDKVNLNYLTVTP